MGTFLPIKSRKTTKNLSLSAQKYNGNHKYKPVTLDIVLYVYKVRFFFRTKKSDIVLL